MDGLKKRILTYRTSRLTNLRRAVLVADHGAIGQLVHPNLGLKPLARNTLQSFINAPVTAFGHDRHAVD